MILETRKRVYRELASRYCEVLEEPTSTLLIIRSSLVALYLASLEMQDETGGDAFTDLPERVSSEDYSKIKKRIEIKMQLDYFSI